MAHLNFVLSGGIRARNGGRAAILWSHGRDRPARRRAPRPDRGAAASSTAPSAASSRSPGAEAKEFLNGQVTNDVEALEPGQGCYAAFLTHKGKMLGDLRVLDTGDELLLDTERVALQELFNMIRRFKVGYDVELHKRTLERGLLSLIGPRAARVAGAEDLPDQEHANADADVDGIPARLVATDVGVDVICDAAGTPTRCARRCASAAPSRSPRTPPSACASSTGRPRYGDRPRRHRDPAGGRPQRARGVASPRAATSGQETVARLHYRGKPNRHLRGLRLSAPAEPGDELRLGEREVGTVGSTAVSPALGPIALALVRREAEPGATVAVGDLRPRARTRHHRAGSRREGPRRERRRGRPHRRSLSRGRPRRRGHPQSTASPARRSRASPKSIHSVTDAQACAARATPSSTSPCATPAPPRGSPRSWGQCWRDSLHLRESIHARSSMQPSGRRAAAGHDR